MNYLPALTPMLRTYGPIASCGATALERIQRKELQLREDEDYLKETLKFFTTMAEATAIYLSETKTLPGALSQEEMEGLEEACYPQLAVVRKTAKLNRLCAISFDHTELFSVIREVKSLRDAVGAEGDAFTSFAAFFKLCAVIGPDIAQKRTCQSPFTQKMIDFLKAFASWAEKVTTPQCEMH